MMEITILYDDWITLCRVWLIIEDYVVIKKCVLLFIIVDFYSDLYIVVCLCVFSKGVHIIYWLYFVHVCIWISNYYKNTRLGKS